MKLIKAMSTMALGACLLLVSGCFTAEIGTTIRQDGSVHQHVEMGMDPSVAALVGDKGNPFDEQQEDFVKHGFTITNTDAGFSAEKDYPNIQSLVATGNKLYNPSEEGKGVKYRKGFFYDTYNFDLILPKDATKQQDVQSDAMTKRFMETAQSHYTLNLPEPPLRTNATDLSNQNTTLRWNLIDNFVEGKEVPIQADFLIHHDKNIKLVQYLGAILFIGALGLVGIGIYRRHIDGKKFLLVGGVACIVLTITGAMLYHNYTHPPTLTEADRIVLTDTK